MTLPATHYLTVNEGKYRLLHWYDGITKASPQILWYYWIRGTWFLRKTKYKDSVSGLYFYDKNVSSYIKMLSKPVTEQYLILRGVVPIDKVVWHVLYLNHDTIFIIAISQFAKHIIHLWFNREYTNITLFLLSCYL